jgi:hypothetical protein
MRQGIKGLIERTPKVFRWSALVVGVWYGYSHQKEIWGKEAKLAEDKEYKKREEWINQARAEYRRKVAPPPQQSSTPEGGMFVEFSSNNDTGNSIVLT